MGYGTACKQLQSFKNWEIQPRFDKIVFPEKRSILLPKQDQLVAVNASFARLIPLMRRLRLI